MRHAGRLLPLLLILAGCSLFQRRPAVLPLQEQVHYTVGAPYQAGGAWRYPRAEYGVDQTGLAAIAPEGSRLTADGEIFDATALAAGHRTLQLPSIARVTNLDNGRQVVLRLNDRGPAAPARMLSLTSRAALLLEAHDGTRLRLQLQDTETRQLAATLDGTGPALDVASVPRGSVQSETLAPLGNAAPSGRGLTAPVTAPVGSLVQAGTGVPANAVPRRLPEAVTQGPPAPANLYIDAGAFGRQDYASILVNRLAPLGARLTTSYTAPRDKAYRIRIGPFTTVPEAEAMLERTISAGVNDAAIVIE